jgi:hypothetical protein
VVMFLGCLFCFLFCFLVSFFMLAWERTCGGVLF